MAKVKKGDTVSAIAAKAKVSVAAIAAANPQIKDLNKIKVGQTVNIPKVDTAVKTATNTYAGGVTGGANPFTAGSGVNTTTLEGILKASGVTAATTPSGGIKPDPKLDAKLDDKPEEEVEEKTNEKTVTNSITNADGTTTIIYSDGTFATMGTPTKPLTADDIAKAVADAMAKITAQQTAAAKLNNQTMVTTALEDFKANLKLAGLDSLADTIDSYIKDDMTASQIKINLVGTQAYKDRFPGMADLAKAGRAVNEATYISMERGMTSILKAYGLDDKIFGTTAKLGTVIANQVSVAEYEQRVSMAADKVKKNTDVLAALNEYYGVTTEGAISYLLDPKLGMDIVKKQIRASEIGAAAEMYKFDLDKAAAESYINVSGTADLNSLKESFGKARILAETQSRLASIEGDKTYNELQAVATTLGNDQQRMLESQRRALREQARFAGQSGISSGSLRKESNI
jgi:murein DD-endopeptidase MepM/ murein hydrolase activator NlpD